MSTCPPSSFTLHSGNYSSFPYLATSHIKKKRVNIKTSITKQHSTQTQHSFLRYHMQLCRLDLPFATWTIPLLISPSSCLTRWRWEASACLHFQKLPEGLERTAAPYRLRQRRASYKTPSSQTTWRGKAKYSWEWSWW